MEGHEKHVALIPVPPHIRVHATPSTYSARATSVAWARTSYVALTATCERCARQRVPTPVARCSGVCVRSSRRVPSVLLRTDYYTTAALLLLVLRLRAK